MFFRDQDLCLYSVYSKKKLFEDYYFKSHFNTWATNFPLSNQGLYFCFAAAWCYEKWKNLFTDEAEMLQVALMKCMITMNNLFFLPSHQFSCDANDC